MNTIFHSATAFTLFFWLTTILCHADAPIEQASFFDPIPKTIEGWTVQVDPSLLQQPHQRLGQQALQALANHLQRVTYIVPASRLKQLRKLPIWLEREHPKLQAMQYHPDRGWLLANGHDPRLTKHVHIPKANALIDPKTWAKHPYVVLHELAHSYHDQVLDFEDERIKQAFDSAQQSKKYESVLAHNGKYVQHYGLSNHKEYFAESSEAYFGVNDFYPFVRAELKEFDNEMYRVLEAIWGKLD